MTKNDLKYFFEEEKVDIFNRDYTANVLGITTTVNEVYDIDTNIQIINEQLLLEGWWDGIEKLPGKIKELFQVLQKIVTQPEYVNKWVHAIKHTIIEKKSNKVFDFLNKLIGSANSKVSELAKTVLNKLKAYYESIYSLSGWKLGIGITGLGLAVQWIWNKFSKLIESTGINLTFQVLDNFMNELGGVVGNLVGSLTGVGALVSWATKVFKGVEFVVNTLENAIKNFTGDDSRFYLHKYESMEKNKIKDILREGLFPESSYMDLKEELDFSSFKMKDELNPKIWDSEENMNEEIRKNLIKIANDYWDSLELGFDYIDITMTGSLANYNWSKFSDVDLHIIFDINKLGENKELVKDLLDVKTRKWNDEHDITIKGFEVELYLQPEDQAHHSTGVYSIIDNEWVTEPEPQEVKLDRPNIKKKYNTIVSTVQDLKKELKSGKDYEDIIDRLNTLKEKIRNMRKSGLETGGEFSPENIAFKLLRRNDIMDGINRMLTKAYDSSVTIEGFGPIINEALLDEDYPKDFDINKFKSLTSWAAKQRYAQEHLGKPIGRGSSRVVYKVDEFKVLKLAKNEKGLKQNEVEIDISQMHYYEDILAQVLDYDKENHLWVEMELARRAKKSDFKSVYGVHFDTMGMHLRNYEQQSQGRRPFFSIPKKTEEEMYENEFVSELQNFMVDTDSLAGDLGAIGSWGMVKRDGIYTPVLIDFGITNEIYQNYYA